MGKVIRMFLMAGILALAPVAAFGQSNTSQVDQFGEGNLAEVYQTGNTNSAFISQGDAQNAIDGLNNTARQNQYGGQENLASIDQTGVNNYAEQSQYGGQSNRGLYQPGRFRG